MPIDIRDYMDKPLFVTDVQKLISALPESRRKRVILSSVIDADRRRRDYSFFLPQHTDLPDALVMSYLLAEINNMVVSFGGESLTAYFDMNDSALRALLESALSRFQADAPYRQRAGYGIYVNYINRMNKIKKLGSFHVACRDILSYREPQPNEVYRIYEAGDIRERRKLLYRAADELGGKCFCSLDIGGNSIKGAVVNNGEIIFIKEYKWCPSYCRTADEMTSPIVMMLRFLADCTVSLLTGKNLGNIYSPCFNPETPYEKMLDAAERIEEAGVSPLRAFDAIVMGFPDNVVNNKVAGGESYKHHGMRNNPELDYELEFEKSASLDILAEPYCREKGPVIVINDANAASIIISIDQAFSGEDSWIPPQGLFANTIGTEMGTGFISQGGTIQSIPLEGFQHIIDIGNFSAAAYEARDVRSNRSLITGIPGTVQRYISQLGLFRMAISGLQARMPEIVEQLVGEGILTRTEDGGLHVQDFPVDHRGRLTQFLIDLAKNNNPVVMACFEKIGQALGVLIDIDLNIFPEISALRFLSGGIVSSDVAFELINKGLQGHNPAFKTIRLDEKTLKSSLLCNMTALRRNFTVAIGSAYIGNLFLLMGREEGGQAEA